MEVGTAGSSSLLPSPWEGGRGGDSLARCVLEMLVLGWSHTVIQVSGWSVGICVSQCCLWWALRTEDISQANAGIGRHWQRG